MSLLYGRNYELVGAYTKIKTAASAAATSLDVDSTVGFNANDFIVIGTPGEELCEVKRITAITDADTLAVVALTNAHAVDEPVSFIPYDQIEFAERESSGGANNVITTKTMVYEDGDYTSYDYPTATTSDYYVYRYYNSHTGNYSEYSSEYQIPTYYCSVEDVEDYLNMLFGNDTEISYNKVEKTISYVTKEIDERTNTSFKSNTVSTSNYEYIDGVGGKLSIDGEEDYRTTYQIKHSPVISITSLSVTTDSDTTDSPTWNSLTENTDYYLDKTTGMFDIVTNSYFPPKGNKRIRIAYTWGRSSVPMDIRRCAVLMVKKDLMLGNASSKVIEGKEGYTSAELTILNMEIDTIINRYRRYDIKIVS